MREREEGERESEESDRASERARERARARERERERESETVSISRRGVMRSSFAHELLMMLHTNTPGFFT
jgi:hypothetical protein